MRSPTLKEILLLSFLCLFGIFIFAAWLASLVIPDWQFFVDNQDWHNATGWVLAIATGALGFILLYFIVDLAIDRQIKDRKIDELEAELERLQKIK